MSGERIIIDFTAAAKPLLEKVKSLASTGTVHGQSEAKGEIIQFPTKQKSPKKPDGPGSSSPAA